MIGSSRYLERSGSGDSSEASVELVDLVRHEARPVIVVDGRLEIRPVAIGDENDGRLQVAELVLDEGERSLVFQNVNHLVVDLLVVQRAESTGALNAGRLGENRDSHDYSLRVERVPFPRAIGANGQGILPPIGVLYPPR